MEILNIKGDYAFSRNPIVIRESYPPYITGGSGGLFSVLVDDRTVYTGHFFPPLDVDVSEVVDACVNFFPEPPEGNTRPLVCIEDLGDMELRKCKVKAKAGDQESEVDFVAIRGGVSRQNFRRLVAVGEDAFTSRFLNPKNNFFLTTRSAGWRVVMKETELYPLYFLTGDENGAIAVVESVSKSAVSLAFTRNAVFALDVAALRRKFGETSGVIPSMLDIYAGGALACRVVVEKSDISKERYRLKFRNSLGVFEIIELAGELSVTPDYSDSEESAFKRLDSVTGAFFYDRDRVERRQSISVETGVKRPDEVRFLMDMLSSDEVYLLDLSALPLKVIPSAENLTYRPRPTAPESFTLKLEVADSELNIMQEIIDGSEGMKPRVFSKQFSKQFN